MAEAVNAQVYSNNNINLTAKKNVHNKKSKLKKISKKNAALASVYVLFTIISIASAIFILSNYQKITALNFEIRQVDAIIVEAEKTQLNLVAEIENIKGTKDIVAEAQNKLGMVYPEQDQVVFFTLEDTAGPERQEGIVSTIFSTLTGYHE